MEDDAVPSLDNGLNQIIQDRTFAGIIMSLSFVGKENMIGKQILMQQRT